jgi:SLT domain-containing protein
MARGNVIEVVVRTTDETREGTESVRRNSNKLKESFADVSARAAGMLSANIISAGVSAFRDFTSGSIEAASDLGESVNAVQQIFGNSQKTILDWGKQNANAFGLSQQAFNELATPLGAGLKNAGLSLQDTSKWTIDLTKRASDMASVFNTSVPDALEAIQAGLRGEADPLERYGVGLSAAKVQAEAMAETGKKGASSLTSQELATARLNLIMKQTSATSGDFQRTSGGLANATRIQEARMKDLQAEIGQKLLPAKLLLVKAEAGFADILANKVIPAIEKFSGWLKKNPDLVRTFAVVIGVVLAAAFYSWAAGAAAAAAATIAATWPIILIVAALAAVAAALVYAYNHSEKFRTVVQAVVAAVVKAFHWLADAIGKVIEWIKDHWGTISHILMTPIRIAVGYIKLQWLIIKSTAEFALKAVIFLFVTLPGKIRSSVGDLRKLLIDKGHDVIQGFWDGLKAIWNKVTGWVGGLAGWIKSHKGPIDFDRRLLEPAGQAIMNGLWNGLKAGAGPIGGWLKEVTGNFGKAGQGAVSAGVERWRDTALRALAYTGSPMSWIGSLLSRMQRESGGNQYAINNWDINAKRGDPSRGLMQTIGGTFSAYARELAGRGIYDPFANIVASIRYANSRYGSAPSGWNRPGGYDSGGWLMPGTTLATNLTGKPEAVFTQDQLASFGGGGARLEVVPGGEGDFERFMVMMIRKWVRVRGGTAEKAFGRG